MTGRKIVTLFLAIVCSWAILHAHVSHAADPQAVEQCIAKAKEYLYSKQKDGTWDPPSRQPNERGEKFDWTAEWTNWGGPTAVIVYSLLAAGESPNDPRLKPAIEFLKKAELKGIYAIGMRSQVWAHLPATPEVKNLIRRDAELLRAAMMTKGPHRGLWSYANHGPAGDNNFDHSNSQYGVLGLRGAAEVGVEVPGATWQMMDKAWRENQHPDGGWSYKRSNDPTQEFTVPRFTMTLAGVATLFLTNDYMNPGSGINCKGNIADANIDRGIEWLGNHFDDLMKADNIIVGGFNYGLYGLERVGVASGRKYIGKVDWYEFGVEQLLKLQSPEGGWRTEQPTTTAATTTALGLLFLGYGHAPVTINKLQWELAEPEGQAKTKPVTANWNQRPRDVANFVRWMGKQAERPLNWQVVSLRFPVETLMDAPILYLAGGQKLNFSDDDASKLRQYVEQGGLIIGNADCANKDFADSFRKLGQKLFPMYEFRELPADHVIYTGQQYARSKWKTPPSVLGLSNGARELMILLPTLDAGKSWQIQAAGGRNESFQLGSNIVLYTNENRSFPSKGETHWITRDDKVAAGKPLKIARLQYAGNWDPEPGGWRRLANILHNKNNLELQVEPIKLGDGKLDSSFMAAHLTGTSAFKLTGEQQAELKKYLDAGGTLIVDAAGGSSAFATSAEAMLATVMPQVKSPYPNLSKEHPAAASIQSPGVRRAAAKVVGKSKAPMPRALEHDGHVVVYYSPLDLSVALVGTPVDGITGYDPATAAQILSGILQNLPSR